MSKHTPGPWKVYEEIDGDQPDLPEQEAEIAIRDLAILADDEGENTIAHVELTNASAEVARADARLIAAAPELCAAVQVLLEAAKEVEDTWEQGDLAKAVRYLSLISKEARDVLKQVEG